MDYFEKYKLEDILPVNELRAESKKIEKRHKKWKNTWFWLMILSALAFILLIGVMYLTVSDSEILPFIIFLFGISPTGILFLVSSFVYFFSLKSVRREKWKSESNKDFNNLPTLTIYNRIIEFNPALQGLKINRLYSTGSLISDQNTLEIIKSFGLTNETLNGSKIDFTYMNKNFTFCVGVMHMSVQKVDSKTANSIISTTSEYITTLLCDELFDNLQNKYKVFPYKLDTPPKNWEKFESESLKFNKKFHVYYNGDDVEAFNLFNPVVLDKFISKPLKGFSNLYLHNTQGVTCNTYDISKATNNTPKNLFGYLDTEDTSLIEDLNFKMKRMEEHIFSVWKLLQYFIPFINQPQPTVS